MNGAQIFTDFAGDVPLVLGAIMILFAAQLSPRSVSGWSQGAGMRALAGFVPIVAGVAVAMGYRRIDLALTIIFSTSIAALSIQNGAIALLSGTAEAPPGAGRFWPFVLPVTLLTLLAGFAGNLKPIHAAIFLAEGMALWLAWREIRRDIPAPQPHSAGPGALSVIAPLCVALATGGAAAAIAGAMPKAQSLPSTQSPVLLALLAPLLILPMLTGGVTAARQGLAWVGISTAAVVVVLNLCLLLPALILVHARISPEDPLVFSVITWRVDNVVLILLAMALVPVSLGRWRFGMAEGLALIGFYLVYILMELIAGLST